MLPVCQTKTGLPKREMVYRDSHAPVSYTHTPLSITDTNPDTFVPANFHIYTVAAFTFSLTYTFSGTKILCIVHVFV